jgi:hypothetical protein
MPYLFAISELTGSTPARRRCRLLTGPGNPRNLAHRLAAARRCSARRSSACSRSAAIRPASHASTDPLRSSAEKSTATSSALQRVRCAIASWAAVADLRAACRAAVRADFVVSVAALPPP